MRLFCFKDPKLGARNDNDQIKIEKLQQLNETR